MIITFKVDMNLAHDPENFTPADGALFRIALAGGVDDQGVENCGFIDGGELPEEDRQFMKALFMGAVVRDGLPWSVRCEPENGESQLWQDYVDTRKP